MPRHFHRMVLAELLKVLTRVSGWAGLALSALLPALIAALLFKLQPEVAAEGVDMQQQMMSSMVPDQAIAVLDWTLTARNILILPMILLLVTAQLFAGEWSQRTLRSLLVRPVSRGSVLMAKFSALWIYAGACLLISYIFALSSGWALLGHEDAISGVSLAFLVCWVRDGAIIGIGMLMSTFAPSVAGVVVGTIIALASEFMLGLAFRAGDALLTWPWVEHVIPWMPASALWSSWEGFEETAWPLEPLGALAILLTLVIVGSLVRFSRLDVP